MAMAFEVLKARIMAGTESSLMLLEGLDSADWDLRTRCEGWLVRDAAWHASWGEGPGEVIRAAKLDLDPPDLATARMGSAPHDSAEIVAALRRKLERTQHDLADVSGDDASMTVRYGAGDGPGTTLQQFLWGRLVEVEVHKDDVASALGIDEPFDDDFAEELVQRQERGAVSRATNDPLQPIKPRGYRYRCGDSEYGFRFADGAWREGAPSRGDGIPTCTFESDWTTLARLVMGRIPTSPYDATWERPWDRRLRITGDELVRLVPDVKRWCYGTW